MSRTRRNAASARAKLPSRVIGRRSQQLPRILVRINIAVAVLIVGVGLATCAFYYLSGGTVSWSDALYMTMITVTTVGYGEIVPLDTVGMRLLAGLVAILGFGTLTFLFTSFTVFFLENDIDYTLRRRRMEKQVRKLQGHYIVCGFGRVGRNVATELMNTNRHFVAIDPEEARFDENKERYPDLLYLHGDASDDDHLAAANIDEAKGVFAVTGDDSRNLMIVITAKQLNPAVRVVARCQEVRNMQKMKKAGADAIVSPDFTGGMRIASAMIRPHVVGFLDEMLKSEKRLRVEEVPVPSDFPDTPLQRLRLRSHEYVLLAVREAHDWVFNPPSDYILRHGQTIITMSSPAGRQELELLLVELCGKG
ncbi:MAG: voltage-gated potassium channel [Pseudomonadota bacterium]|nr:voltage-gated potassium channel [Pseudomonadota bacterium]MDQ5917599.1 voltage-gated potassium channel [Pseudomonadota bacterium]MDQ5960285.1 voltage-gated potassium channel [Pseudomonadota bacterium]